MPVLAVAKLLVVEDEPRIASFLAKGLRAHGYDVEQASTGQEALQLGTQPGLCLVILDLRLPDLDGLEVLASLRAWGATVPVLILSAWGRVEDRVRGLDLGADDYLAKPFAFEELLARVRARLRLATAAPAAVLRAGSICLNVLTREATSGGRKLNLSAREFALLRAFVAHPGQTLSRQELLSMAWNIDFDPQTNLIDVYVGYLRRKLSQPVIETVRGTGYRLRTRPADGPATISEHRPRKPLFRLPPAPTRGRAIPRANLDSLQATTSHAGRISGLVKYPVSPVRRRPATLRM